MKIHLLKLLFIVLITCAWPGYAQKLTSSASDKVSVADTVKIKALSNAAYELIDINPDSAILITNQLLEMVNKLPELPNNWKEVAKIRLYTNLGLGNHAKGEYPKAFEYLTKSLKISESFSFKKGMANAYGNLGRVYYAQGNFKKSIEYHLQALKINEETANKKQIVINLGNLGNVYYAQLDYKKALEYDLKAFKIAESANDKDGMTINLGNIANIYADQKNFPKALEYYQKSLKTARELDNTMYVVTTLFNIGTVHADLGNANEAISYCKQSAAIAKEIGFRELLKEIYGTLAKVYAQQRKFSEAYSYQQQFIAVKDSLYNEENSKAIAGVQALYEGEKKDKEIQLLRKDKEKQEAVSIAEAKKKEVILISTISIIILLSCFGFFMVNRFVVIRKQKHIIEEKNREITDSINYALLIQHAILPSIDLIYTTLKESFILYKPKDVVSGDFYAFAEKQGKVILAAVDCTGHGVPGAFMSMIGHNLLSEIVVERGITSPSIILEELNRAVRKSLRQDENMTKDGMDAAIVTIDIATKRLQYAGANRPLWIIKNNVSGQATQILQEIKATKTAIGGHTPIDQVFENHEVPVETGDSIYIFSDGYADQFGGADGKKFMTKRFKEVLLGMQHTPMREQEQALNKAFEDWKGEYEQVDDVLVIGVRV